MIIDFHTHIFPDAIAPKALANLSTASNTTPFTDGTASGLQNSMKDSGVNLSVILPVVTNAVKASSINQKSARINETTSETGLLSFGGIHPETPNLKEVIKEAKELGLKGFKLHPDHYNMNLDDLRCMRMMEEICNQQMIIVTHAGVDIGHSGPPRCTPDMICHVLDEVKPERMVLAHMGSWQLWDDVIHKLASRRVYMDTGFSLGTLHWIDPSRRKPYDTLSPEKLVEMIRIIGSERILFATDSPWAPQKKYVEIMEKLPLSEEEKNNIFHKNAEKLLGL